MSEKMFLTILIAFLIFFWVKYVSTKSPHFPVFFRPCFAVAFSALLTFLVWIV